MANGRILHGFKVVLKMADEKRKQAMDIRSTVDMKIYIYKEKTNVSEWIGLSTNDKDIHCFN